MQSKLSLINIRTLEGKAERMLARYPETRDSDVTLQAYICENFYPKMENPIRNWTDFVHTMQNLPKADHIARVRRKIIEKNNYKKYLPTRLEIAIARGYNEQIWREYAKSEGITEHNPNNAAGNMPPNMNEDREPLS